jgi:hypothetical protein
MRLRSTLALPFLFFSAAPLLAQAPDLASAVALVETGGPLTQILESDLNVDGTPEALLIHAEGCEGSTCPWTLIGAYPDRSGWGPVAAGFGARTELVDTAPAGQVIRSDGVILAWDGRVLSPHFDLLTTAPKRRASAQEARFLGRALPGSFRPIEMQVYEIDPFRSDDIWQLITVEGAPGSQGDPSTFHLLGPDGGVRFSGASLGRPWVYADRDAAGPVLRLVSMTRSGLVVEGVR